MDSTSKLRGYLKVLHVRFHTLCHAAVSLCLLLGRLACLNLPLKCSLCLSLQLECSLRGATSSWRLGLK